MLERIQIVAWWESIDQFAQLTRITIGEAEVWLDGKCIGTVRRETSTGWGDGWRPYAAGKDYPCGLPKGRRREAVRRLVQYTLEQAGHRQDGRIISDPVEPS